MSYHNLLLIGVCGGSASGKSSISKYILNYFGKEKCGIIEVDSYYNDLSHIRFEEREKNNFDHPDAFDFNLLYQDIKQLKNSTLIKIPSYDYITHTRNKKKIKIKNNPIVIIEGIFSIYYKKLRDVIDLKIYLDTPEIISKSRRIIRDKESRGRTEKSILKQYQKTVYPMYVEFVKPLMKYSNLIIKDNSVNSNGINILNDYINAILDEKL